MRARLTQLLTVIGAVTVLVLAANTVALAATGHDFLLGQTNQTAGLTTLQRVTLGPALSLQTKNDTAAPFTTNATGKVKNLNADTLDGLDSKALRDATSLQGMTPYEIERAALDGRYPYEVINYAQLTNWSTDAPATSATINLGNQYGQRLATYNVVLTGASGHTSCSFGLEDPVVGSGLPHYSDLRTTSTETSPGISGVGVVTGANHDFALLKCDSDTAFTVKGIVTTFMVVP